MCGIACYLGNSVEVGQRFINISKEKLIHRGPDDYGVFNDAGISFLHRRLSILELSDLGHQPMSSSNGRYTIVFNGEIYNHLDLRSKYLSGHKFRGHSDTETIIELFSLLKEKMLEEMIGMWAITIWDNEAKRLFITRDRYGQKPIYIRKGNNEWYFASEMKVLLDSMSNAFDPLQLVEYIALGNYGHLGEHTFFHNIKHFPQGSYAWVDAHDSELNPKRYWYLPNIKESDKIPFDKDAKNRLHDIMVEAVLSQTLSDVPIGLTLSGGIDSSIVAGILGAYYKDDVHIFTAQAKNSKYDETKYVDAVLAHSSKKFIVHRQDSSDIVLSKSLEKYINIQEEPFGDPSIIAHGTLMDMTAKAGIKVILNGQGADELFFGYTNMAQSILIQQFKKMKFFDVYKNLSAMGMGNKYIMRVVFSSLFPKKESDIRNKSRLSRRGHIVESLMDKVRDVNIELPSYDSFYDVWVESVYGIHIPHLVQYDDRNGMANSIEGRMPFLDHRIADFVATIKSHEFLKYGKRKYILREACKNYIPDIVYNRKDKIGFHTPLPDLLKKEKEWVWNNVNEIGFVNEDFKKKLHGLLNSDNLQVNDALHVWRALSVIIWAKSFKVAL